jgi:pimeloyl-ACP methyl ester carboxylesterase
MLNARLLLVLILGCSAALVGCGDDSGNGQSNALQDTDISADAGDVSEDALGDGGHDGDVGEDSDAEAPSCEAFPAPEIAGTTETDTLANAPARCGQPSHTWIEDPRLGEVTQIGVEKDFPAAFIEGILSSENINAPREIAHDARVVQYAYMTQDRGQLVEASAMVAFPTDRQPGAEPREVLLLLHGTTGFTDACAPSSDLASQGLAALLASFGYMVVAPDYIGLKGFADPTGFLHPYLVGQSTAISSLDAVRAAANLPSDKRGDWCLKPEVVAFGGSQGGHAALWVDRLAPYYARELELLGSVATVPPADMLGQMDRALEQYVNATGNTVAFLGTTASWYGVEDRLDEVFVSPYETDIPDALGSTCDFGDIAPDVSSTTDIFQQALVDAAVDDTLGSVEPWGCITAENGLTTTSVPRLEPTSDSYGVMFVVGENDELVHTPIERDAFVELCDQGMQMEFLECAGAGHGETTFFAMPEILDFVDARIDRVQFDDAAACQLTSPTACRGTQ